MQYLASVLSGTFSNIFIIFTIAALGYLAGSVKVKGISLGTAGVLLTAMLFGIAASKAPSFFIGDTEIVLMGSASASAYSMLSSLGTALFVSSVGLIAGPRFFAALSRKFIAYIIGGVFIIAVGAASCLLLLGLDPGLDPEMAVGLMAGALTSTPALSAATEVAQDAGAVIAGYGIAYIFGVLGVVLFVQIMPRLLKADAEAERKKIASPGGDGPGETAKKSRPVELSGIFAFSLTVALGCLIGAIKIPGAGFSLGNSGGCLFSGILVGHFGRIGKTDLSIPRPTLLLLRELGLLLFLIGAGVPGGVRFMDNIKLKYFLYGMIMTLLPMIAGYILIRKTFKADLFNALGSVTGGMTSTPALGSLIAASGSDDVTAAYAATYPAALITVVLAAKLILLPGL